jgi:hypothetical protein
LLLAPQINGDSKLNKNGVFLVIFLLLLGVAVVPITPEYSTTIATKSSAATESALATTGTLRITVSEDVGVANGSYADTNFGDPINDMFVGTGYDVGIWSIGRSWFKFDLTHLPKELSVQRATMNMYIESEWSTTDEPVGVYHSSDDSWDYSTLTWNNAPAISSTPSDVISSPASPNMFEPLNWYSWEVTSDVRSSLTAEDMMLTEVLKQTVEVGTQNAFWYPTRLLTSQFYAAYLEIEYMTPDTTDLSVDGISSGPFLEYINNPCPELGWNFLDQDNNDFQKDYDVELWNNTHYNDSMLWQASHERVSFIHESGSVSGNSHPFGSAEEFRLQMKFPGSEFSSSGIVDKLYFTSTDEFGDMQIEDLEISLLMVPSTAALTTDFAANYEGRTPTVVLSREIYEVSVEDYSLVIDVEDTFFLNEYLNLIIEIRLTNNTGDLVNLARTSSGPGSVATNAGYSEAPTTTYTAARTYDLKIGYLTKSVYEDTMDSWNAFPFGTTDGYPGRFQIKYNQSYINRAGYLDKIYFRVNSIDGEVVYENFTVTLVETPVKGHLNHTDWTANYGGSTPVQVLDASLYTIHNVGNALVIDFDNTFYYTNTNDLLIDLQWDSFVSGFEIVNWDVGHSSSYRAWDVRYNFNFQNDHGVAGYDLLVDFVNNEDQVTLEGCITLEDGTWYYLRARTCDSFGIWGDWTTLQFKYEVISEVPFFTPPEAVPDPATVGEDLSVSLNVTHSLGVYEVLIAYDGLNHTMTAVGDTYSYTWVPATAELLNYTIYMRSNGNTWSYIDDMVLVQTPSEPPGDFTMLLIIGGAAVVVVILVVAVLKKKPAKK